MLPFPEAHNSYLYRLFIARRWKHSASLRRNSFWSSAIGASGVACCFSSGLFTLIDYFGLVFGVYVVFFCFRTNFLYMARDWSYCNWKIPNNTRPLPLLQCITWLKELFVLSFLLFLKCTLIQLLWKLGVFMLKLSILYLSTHFD